VPVLLMYLVAGGGIALITAVGWAWRWRRALSAACAAIVTTPVVAAVVVVVWPHAFPQPPLGVSAAPSTPTLTVLTWGEHDSYTDALSAATPTPAHIIVAELEIIAGDTALSIPALGTSTPANLLWLAVRDTGRSPLTDQTRRTPDGTLWLPSHSAELVENFGAAPLMFPDAGCTYLASGDRCSITVVWEMAEHGNVAVTSLALLPADTDPATETATSVTLWPAPDTAQPVCDGLIKAWCGNT
jgi:hypothetical protein